MRGTALPCWQPTDKKRPLAQVAALGPYSVMETAACEESLTPGDSSDSPAPVIILPVKEALHN